MAHPKQSELDLTKVEAFRVGLLKRRFAANTVQGYASDWQNFERWCASAERQPLPASSETLCLYLSAMLADGFRFTTAERRLSAVLHVHRLKEQPRPDTTEARELLNAGRRLQRGQSNAKAALTVEHVRRMLDNLDLTDGLAVRNKALLLVGFTTGMRRSEIVSIQMAHLTEHERGTVIYLPFSKRDQVGNGRYIGCFRASDLELCPVEALRQWLVLRGSSTGPVFCRFRNGRACPKESVTGAVVNSLVQEACEWIGLNPARYGAHSLRSGFVTSAGRNGTSPLVIMRTTGHTDLKTVQRYFRMDEALEINPLQGVL